MGFFFNRKPKSSPATPIDPKVAERWVKSFADKDNTDEVLVEKAVAIVPVLKQETRHVAIGIASTDAKDKIPEVAYELLYFYLYLCYLTASRTLVDEKAALFINILVSNLIQERYRGDHPAMSDEEAKKVFMDEYWQRHTAWSNYTSLLGNRDQTTEADLFTDFIRSLCRIMNLQVDGGRLAAIFLVLMSSLQTLAISTLIHGRNSKEIWENT